jgi:phospholipase/carboxylesterase
MATLPLVHLVRLPSPQTGNPPLLILLHGVGSNEYDLFELAPLLDQRFLILSLRAPITLAPGSDAWFEVGFTPQGPIINPEQAEQSRQLLIDFIGQALATYNANPRQVYLMGFSQGAIMSASVALTRPDLVAGAVLMSGRVLPELQPVMAPREQLADLPILVVHGTMDTILPIHNGRASRDLLSTLPVDLTYREYAMGHEVSPESLADVRTWLSERMDQVHDI